MIPKIIIKPEGSDNFETLCLKLWKEVWDCSNIKKNGRNGQVQNGVDIFGIPKNEIEYFGIQCKSKNENKNSLLTKLEIEKEIEAAKSFKPPLKTFYVVTSSNRDAKLQEYIRIKNLENLQNELFNLDIFFWEDIEELIKENPKTFDWYVKQKQFQTNFGVEVRFKEGGNFTTQKPIFSNYNVNYTSRSNFEELFGAAEMQDLVDGLNQTHRELTGLSKKKGDKLINPANLPWLNEHDDGNSALVNNSEEYFEYCNALYEEPFKIKEALPCQPIVEQGSLISSYKEYNHSICNLGIVIKNIGNTPLEEVRFKITIENVQEYDIVDKDPSIIIRINAPKYNVKFLNHSKSFISSHKLLLETEEAYIDLLCFRPFPRVYEVKIKWELLARDFRQEGFLTVNVDPIIESHTGVIYLDPVKEKPKSIFKDFYSSRNYEECSKEIVFLESIGEEE